MNYDLFYIKNLKLVFFFHTCVCMRDLFKLIYQYDNLTPKAIMHERFFFLVPPCIHLARTKAIMHVTVYVRYIIIVKNQNNLDYLFFFLV